MNPVKVVLPLKAIKQKDRKKIFATISKWEEVCYGEGKFRTPDQLEEWMSYNDNGFLCCFHGETLIAYTDLWSIEKEVFDLLKIGMILEEEIPPTALCNLRNFEPQLYIGSIITNPFLKGKEVLNGAFKQTNNALATLIEHYAEIHALPIEILSVGSSSIGVRILTMMKFSKVKMADTPVDTRQRYTKIITKMSDLVDLKL